MIRALLLVLGVLVLVLMVCAVAALMLSGRISNEERASCPRLRNRRGLCRCGEHDDPVAATVPLRKVSR